VSPFSDPALRTSHVITLKMRFDACASVPERPVSPMGEESAIREEWTSFIAERDDLFTPHPDEALAKRK